MTFLFSLSIISIVYIKIQFYLNITLKKGKIIMELKKLKAKPLKRLNNIDTYKHTNDLSPDESHILKLGIQKLLKYINITEKSLDTL